MKQKLIIVGLILVFFLLSAMNYPSRGTDYSSYRCSGGLVSKGDLARDVYGKCGDPIRETRIAREPHRVFVYRFGQKRFVYYFAFLHERLQRIYAVNCLQDDPHCE